MVTNTFFDKFIILIVYTKGEIQKISSNDQYKHKYEPLKYWIFSIEHIKSEKSILKNKEDVWTKKI